MSRKMVNQLLLRYSFLNIVTMFKGPVITAPFKEHIVVDVAYYEPTELDVYATEENHSSSFMRGEKFALQQYCFCLLQKLVTLNKSRIKPFIVYQCEQLNDPFVWLNKLEKLIDLNRDTFTTKDHNIKIEKALMVIELVRQDIESNKFNKTNQFDFNKVKRKLAEYSEVGDKICYLLEMETDYKQNKPAYQQPGTIPFDEQLELERNKIEQIEILKEKYNNRVQLIKGNNSQPTLQLTCNINYFVDIFYQLMHEKGLIIGTSKDMAQVISTNFLDKDNQPLSFDSVNTMLKPSNHLKRPKGNSRYQFE